LFDRWNAVSLKSASTLPKIVALLKSSSSSPVHPKLSASNVTFVVPPPDQWIVFSASVCAKQSVANFSVLRVATFHVEIAAGNPDQLDASMIIIVDADATCIIQVVPVADLDDAQT
jgi:hypothetical protein